METRISVPMTIEEREALRAYAKREMRQPQAQARYLLRLALGLVEQPETRNRGAVDPEQAHAAVAS